MKKSQLSNQPPMKMETELLETDTSSPLPKKRSLLVWLWLCLPVIAIVLLGLYFRGGSTDVLPDIPALSTTEHHWQRVFAKAFEPVDCPEPRDPATLPKGYYKGPMIDTHIHMQSLPDGEPGMPLDSYGGENIGTKRSVDQWACILDVEATKQAFVFFPVWEPIVKESVELVRQAMEKYPGRFVPFAMVPDDDGSPDGSPTVDAAILESFLNIEPGLFRGHGESGLYGHTGGAHALPPDSPRMMEIYKVAKSHRLLVYMHLGEGQKDALKRAAAANPDVTFIFHGDQLIDCEKCDGTHSQVAEILEASPNVFYGVDELYGGEWLLKPDARKETFLQHFTTYKPLLEADQIKFKTFIEKHPDQVVWGTDRGVGPSWDKDPDVALILNDYARAFIGQLDPVVQEKIAYRNAERLLPL